MNPTSTLPRLLVLERIQATRLRSRPSFCALTRPPHLLQLRHASTPAYRDAPVIPLPTDKTLSQQERSEAMNESVGMMKDRGAFRHYGEDGDLSKEAEKYFYVPPPSIFPTTLTFTRNQRSAYLWAMWYNLCGKWQNYLANRSQNFVMTQMHYLGEPAPSLAVFRPYIGLGRRRQPTLRAQARFDRRSERIASTVKVTELNRLAQRYKRAQTYWEWVSDPFIGQAWGSRLVRILDELSPFNYGWFGWSVKRWGRIWDTDLIEQVKVTQKKVAGMVYSTTPRNVSDHLIYSRYVARDFVTQARARLRREFPDQTVRSELLEYVKEPKVVSVRTAENARAVDAENEKSFILYAIVQAQTKQSLTVGSGQAQTFDVTEYLMFARESVRGGQPRPRPPTTPISHRWQLVSSIFPIPAEAYEEHRWLPPTRAQKREWSLPRRSWSVLTARYRNGTIWQKLRIWGNGAIVVGIVGLAAYFGGLVLWHFGSWCGRKVVGAWRMITGRRKEETVRPLALEGADRGSDSGEEKRT